MSNKTAEQELEEYARKMEELKKKEELKKRQAEAREGLEEDETANVRGTKIKKDKTTKFPKVFGLFGD